MAIKEKLSSWKLRSINDKERANKNFVNINNAVNIGIIWSDDDKEIFEILSKNLSHRTINTDDILFSKHNGEQTFSSKDFSLFGNPKTDLLNKFIDKQYDILIDISSTENTYIQIIRALSKAKFRVSCQKPDNKYLDFNIEIKDASNKTLAIQQMLHYLEVINKTR